MGNSQIINICFSPIELRVNSPFGHGQYKKNLKCKIEWLKAAN